MPDDVVSRYEGISGLAAVPGGFLAMLQGDGLLTMTGRTVADVSQVPGVVDGHSVCGYDHNRF